MRRTRVKDREFTRRTGVKDRECIRRTGVKDSKFTKRTGVKDRGYTRTGFEDKVFTRGVGVKDSGFERGTRDKDTAIYFSSLFYTITGNFRHFQWIKLYVEGKGKWTNFQQSPLGYNNPFSDEYS